MFKQIFEVFWPKAEESDAEQEQGLNNALNSNSQRENGFNMIQRCFLYFSLYPEDYEIDRDDLVRKFISEGLVDGRSMRAQVEQGRYILDELVDVCLLETCVDSYGRKCVKMHDVVRSMALRICKGAGNLHIGEPVLDSRGSQGERLLTNEIVGDAFIEIPEMDLNRMEDRQVSQMPMAPSRSRTPPSLQTLMAPSPTQTPPSLQTPMAPSPSQTPPSPPPLMQFLQYAVPTMLVFLTIRYEAKPDVLFGRHRIPLRCFIATTSIYWLTVGVMKQMALTTKARKMCYDLVLSRIALVSGIQSVLFLLSMFMNHVPPTIISLFISAPIVLLIAYLLIKMVFGAGGRNSTDQPVRLPV